MRNSIINDKVHLYHALIIVVLTFAIHSIALKNDFSLDDPGLVVNNTAVHGLSFNNLKAVFLSVPNHFEYLPIRDVSYMLDYELWGLDPSGYHLSNITYYVLSCIILYFFLRYLLSRFTRHGELISFLTVLLFAAHPVHVENVAAVSHRKDLLAFLFLIFSIYCFFLHVHRKKLIYYFLSLAAALFSIMSKGTSVVLPFLALLIVTSLPEEPETKSFQQSMKLIPHLLIVALFSLIQIKILSSTSGMQTHYSLEYYLHRIYSSPVALLYYVKLLFLPYPLTILHSFHVYDHFLDVTVLFSIVTVCLTIFMAWGYRNTRPMVYLALGWFLIGAFPVIGIVPTPSIVVERYLIVPSVGFCLLLGLFFQYLLGKKKIMKKLAIGVFTGLLIVYSISSFNRALDWKSSLTLYLAGIKTNSDSARMYWMVGRTYLREGRYDKSLEYFKKAGESNKSYKIDYQVMEALVDLLRGDPKAALFSLDTIVDPKKDYIFEVNFIYAEAYKALGMPGAALNSYDRALQADKSLDMFSNALKADIVKRRNQLLLNQ